MAKNTASKSLILTGTDKGGRGKTLFNATLIEWLLDQHASLRVQAFDPDEANRSLSTRLPKLTELLPIRATTGRDGVSSALDRIFESLQDGDDVVVMDAMGSQQTATLFPWATQTGLWEHALEDHGTAVTILLHVGQMNELVEQAGAVASAVGSAANYVIVRNTWADSDMPLWTESHARRRLINELGAVEIDSHPLNDALIAKIWTQRTSPIGLGRFGTHIQQWDKRRCETWLGKMFEGFNRAASHLLPPQYYEHRNAVALSMPGSIVSVAA